MKNIWTTLDWNILSAPFPFVSFTLPVSRKKNNNKWCIIAKMNQIERIFDWRQLQRALSLCTKGVISLYRNKNLLFFFCFIYYLLLVLLLGYLHPCCFFFFSCSWQSIFQMVWVTMTMLQRSTMHIAVFYQKERQIR